MSRDHKLHVMRSVLGKLGLVFLVIGLNALAPSFIKAQNDDDLFPFIQDDKIGYINKAGKVVISPQFNREFINQSSLNVVRFSEGLAAANIKGKWGYIDTTGTVVIKPIYSTAWPFSEGLAEVRTSDGKSGYINNAGKMIVAPISSMGSNPFSGGLAGVYIGETSKGQWGFIDKTGAMVIEPSFEAAGPFSEGLALVRIGDKYGFIDREGNYAIPLQNKYLYGPPFHGGFAPVWNAERKGDLIDKSGKILCGFRYRSISPFSEGLAVVDVNIEGEAPTGEATVPEKPQIGRRAAGYLNATCQIVIEPKFEYAGSFSEGLAVFGIASPSNGIGPPSNMNGYIDKTGAVIIPPSFTVAHPFHAGLALVATGELSNLKWGYIDTSGTYVWQEK